jgi:hypothetical protein
MKLRVERMLLGFLAVAVLGSIAGCASNKGSTPNSTSAVLRGMVYNEDRMPVLDMKVSWIQGGSVNQTTLTDIHGRYLIPDMPYGTVTLQFEKDRYEPLLWTFTFDGPTQVVYVKMANMDELLDDAADDIQKKNWTSAASYLERVRKIEPDNSIAAFLEAEMLSRQGSPGQAAALLEKLSSGRDSSFTVELALADLYQYKLAQPDNALLHLKKALTIQHDVDIENRISALEKK